jgi:hypothetical protein
MFNLFRAATTVSIFMSVCAFHSMLETGAVNVGRLSSVDSIIESQKEHIIQSLENLRRQRSRYVVFSKSTDEIDQQIKNYERKLESITNQILQQNDTAMAQDQVSVMSTYKSIANDFIIFWSLTDSVSLRLELIFKYLMLLAMAAMMDLTGTYLVAQAFEPHKLAGEILQDHEDIPAQFCPGANEAVAPPKSDLMSTKFSSFKNDEKSDKYSGACPGVKSGANCMVADGQNDRPVHAKIDEVCPGAEGGADPSVKLAELGVTPELETQILEASKHLDSVNKIQNHVWETGKSSTRGKMVNAVLKHHGITDLPWDDSNESQTIVKNESAAA